MVLRLLEERPAILCGMHSQLCHSMRKELELKIKTILLKKHTQRTKQKTNHHPFCKREM